MEIKETEFKGLFEIVPRSFEDERGLFFESYHQIKFREAGIEAQLPPYDQGKLVRVISGRALDVAVDLREGSPTFGQHIAKVLESNLGNMLYIPPGFAHGFVALTDCIFFYKCTNFYDKPSDGGLKWDDPDLNIQWGIAEPNVSEKDIALPSLSDFLKGNNPWVF